MSAFRWGRQWYSFSTERQAVLVYEKLSKQCVGRQTLFEFFHNHLVRRSNGSGLLVGQVLIHFTMKNMRLVRIIADTSPDFARVQPVHAKTLTDDGDEIRVARWCLCCLREEVTTASRMADTADALNERAKMIGD